MATIRSIRLEMSDEPHPAPDKDHILVFPGYGGQVLLNQFTGESHFMEKLPQPWLLHHDAAGNCFVQSGNRTEWVANFLKFPLYPGAGEGEFMVSTDEQQSNLVPLDDWLKRMTGDRQLSIVSPPHGEIKLQVYVLQPASRGASIWWDVLDVYRQLHFQGKKKAGKWAAAGWSRWISYCAESCGLVGHLVNKAPAGYENRGEMLGQRMLEGDRCADFRMVSSHALVALLARWGFVGEHSGGMKSDEDRLSARGLLRALLDKVALCDVTFFLANGDISPGGWLVGSRAVVLPFSNGGLKLHGLSTVNNSICRAICKKLPAFANDAEARISFFAFLEAMAQSASREKDLQCAFRQLVVSLGKLVDRTFLAEGDQSLSLACGVDSRSGVKMMTKYWIAMREAFDRPQFLHMALDMGNVGKKPTFCGALALPTNIGVIFPPKVGSREIAGPPQYS